MQLQNWHRDPDRGSQEQPGGWENRTEDRQLPGREGETFPPEPKAREPAGWRQASVVNEPRTQMTTEFYKMGARVLL